MFHINAIQNWHKKYGQRTVAAMLKEYTQLTDTEVIGFLRYDQLTEEQKRTV